MNLASESIIRGRITAQIDHAHELTIYCCGGELAFNDIISQMKLFYQGVDAPHTKNILWDIRNASIASLTVDQIYHIASQFNFVMHGGKTAVVASQDINYDIVKIFEAEVVNASRDFIVFHKMDEAVSWLEK